MRFQWNRAKAAVNLRKHGVSFDEAQTVNKALRAIISILPPQPEQRKTTGKT